MELAEGQVVGLGFNTDLSDSRTFALKHGTLVSLMKILWELHSTVQT